MQPTEHTFPTPRPKTSQPRSGERIQPTAQAVGEQIKKKDSPGGATDTDLIPDVSFVIGNLIALQESHQFLLEVPFRVMLLLIRDVPRDFGDA